MESKQLICLFAASGLLPLAVAEAQPPEKISLWNGRAPIGEGRIADDDAFITVFRPAEIDGAALVICPGGGYGALVTGPEGTGIAQWLNQQGITGIVLEYRLPRGNRFVPLLDAQRAIRTARFRAKEWGLDPERIGIIGFSAGGHLASMAVTRNDDGDPLAPEPVEGMSCRPDFAILVYSVITMGPGGHAGTRTNLLGPNPPPELIEMYSSERQVTSRACPTFLAHARDDEAVPCRNSIMFHEALIARGISSKYLELPSGGHGLNGYKGPMWDAWQAESLAWLESLGFIRKRQ